MVLSKLPVPGRPANLDNGREGAGGGCLDICFSRLSLFLPLWETVRYRLKYYL